MAAFSGSAMVIHFLQGAGTVVMNGDYRTFTYTPSIDLADQTAGNDTNKSYIATMKDGKASFGGLIQGSNVAGGTLMVAGCAEGLTGTLKWSPEGTAAGKTLYTMPVIAQGGAISFPYADVCDVKIDFQQNGARTEGTN
jgi:hypothetical protein